MLMFEHLTFQVFDSPDFKVNVYTPLDEADTSAKLAQLLAEQSSASRGSEYRPSAIFNGSLSMMHNTALLSPTNSCRGAWPIVSRIRAGQHLRIGELAPGLVAQRERQLIAWQGQKVAQLAHQI
jgi:hypothetical protein